MTLAIVGFWANRPSRVDVNFVTEAPFFEASIYLDGRQQRQPDGTPYATPCTIENLPARVHHVLFTRDGLPDHDIGQVDFAEVRQVVARWDSQR